MANITIHKMVKTLSEQFKFLRHTGTIKSVQMKDQNNARRRFSTEINTQQKPK